MFYCFVKSHPAANTEVIFILAFGSYSYQLQQIINKSCSTYLDVIIFIFCLQISGQAYHFPRTEIAMECFFVYVHSCFGLASARLSVRFGGIHKTRKLLRGDSSFFCIDHCVKSVQIRSFFWSIFSRIRTEYRKILRIQSGCGKIPTRKNSVFGPFSRSKLFSE